MRRLFTGAISLLLVVLAAAAAFAQTPVQIRIREAALDRDGGVRLVVQVTGDGVPAVIAPEVFRVTEAGRPVEGVSVQPLLQSKLQPVAVALLIDVSGSTKGQPLEDAKSAAIDFVGRLPDGVRIALVAFGPTAELKTELTGDREAVINAIGTLAANGETALYDGIKAGAEAIASIDGQREVVLFSDGKDTVSGTTVVGALEAAAAAEARVTAVGLATRDYDEASLRRIADETDGRVLSVGQSAELSAAFQQVAKDIASSYVLTYTGTRTSPKELDLAVSVDIVGTNVSDTITVVNPRAAPPAADGPAFESPPAGIFASRTGLYLGIVAAFASLALLFGVLFWRSSGNALKLVRRGLRLSTRRAGDRDAGVVTSMLARRAVAFVDQVPKPKGLEERLQLTLERAGWPLRASELLALQALAGAGGAAIGLALFSSAWLGILLVLVGVGLPRLILSSQVRRRSQTFVSQLPDTLQLLSASLQAGYGLLQAIDTVTKEAPAPTSAEFSRVLTEARLGMPLDQALESMAARVANEDFRWVVMAINIQRQVGGNLAQVLETVAATLREREQLRRQVKVLSAEGRLSAVILTVLPFLLAGYMAVVNPEYVGELFRHGLGKVMVVAALALMGVGGLWMRRLVKVEI